MQNAWCSCKSSQTKILNISYTGKKQIHFIKQANDISPLENTVDNILIFLSSMIFKLINKFLF